MKKKQKGNSKLGDFIGIFIQVLLFLPLILCLILYILTRLEQYKNDRNIYCREVCESRSYIILGNNCVCENGTKYPIEE